MGKRGPRPTPTKILQLRGSREVTGRAAEPEPTPGTPPIPAWLSPQARKHWAWIVGVLEPVGVLTLEDGGAMGLLVEALASFEEARRQAAKAKKDKRDFDQKIYLSWTRLQMAAWEKVLKAFQEFGMSPSSRSGVKVTGGAENKDPLKAFVAKKA